MFGQFKKTIGFSAVLCSLVLLSNVSYGAGYGEVRANTFDKDGVSQMQHAKNYIRDYNKEAEKAEPLEEIQKDNSGGQSKGVSSVDGETQGQEEGASFLNFIHEFVRGIGQNWRVYL